MPLLLLALGSVGLGSFLSSNALAPQAPSAAADGNLATPSIYTVAVYGAVGLGLYWMYRKASKA